IRQLKRRTQGKLTKLSSRAGYPAPGDTTTFRRRGSRRARKRGTPRQRPEPPLPPPATGRPVRPRVAAAARPAVLFPRPARALPSGPHRPGRVSPRRRADVLAVRPDERPLLLFAHRPDRHHHPDRGRAGGRPPPPEALRQLAALVGRRCLGRRGVRLGNAPPLRAQGGRVGIRLVAPGERAGEASRRVYPAETSPAARSAPASAV